MTSNEEPRPAVAALDETEVRLVGVRLGGDVCPAVGPRSYLHAGPPIDLGEMLAPMRAAVMGALVLEGEAETLDVAESIVGSGGVELASCHELGAVGAVAGIVSPHIPVVVVETGGGQRTFAPLHEGMGPSLRYGAYGPETLDRLRWLIEVLAPALDAASAEEPIDLIDLQAEALRRGDECHNRNVAASAALLLRLAPALVRALPTDQAAEVLADLGANPQFYLAFSMAVGKALADEAQATDDAGIVTAMCANGRRFGIRVAGLGGRWFVTAAPSGEPKVFEGYTRDDAAPMMGDSFITEAVGLGAFAFSAAPALGSFIGADPTRAVEQVAEMRQIAAGTSSRFLLPFEGYCGTPIGIDVRKVAETGITPVVNGGFAHKNAGVGMVGAGVVRLPAEPFLEANSALDDR